MVDLWYLHLLVESQILSHLYMPKSICVLGCDISCTVSIPSHLPEQSSWPFIPFMTLMSTTRNVLWLYRGKYRYTFLLGRWCPHWPLLPLLKPDSSTVFLSNFSFPITAVWNNQVDTGLCNALLTNRATQSTFNRDLWTSKLCVQSCWYYMQQMQMKIQFSYIPFKSKDSAFISE